MDIAVIRDVTDPHILQPDANSVLGLFNLSENSNAGVRFRYREICDKVLVPTVELQVPDESITSRLNRNNDAFYRKKIILNFYSAIRKTLIVTEADKDSSFLDYSECFKAISGELSLLADCNSNKRVLIVFSNLFENSTILTVYAKKVNQLSTLNPDKIAAIFEKTQLLPENLKGIKIYFAFQPATRDEDNQYLKMADIYKRLLIKRGAIVKIQANNNF